MNTVLIRKVYKMTQQELSDYFGIPVSTIKNWDARDCMPSYVEDMMEKLIHLRSVCNKYESEYKESAFAVKTRMAWDDIVYTALNITDVHPFEEEDQ